MTDNMMNNATDTSPDNTTSNDISNGFSNETIIRHGSISPLEQIRVIVAALEDKKAERVRALDLSGVSDALDYFVIASATSQPQLQALERNVSEKLREYGIRPASIEGPSPRWVLMNYGSVIVHLMTPEARNFYDLENLWIDARPVALTATPLA
jgi:ribosome-associated protein